MKKITKIQKSDGAVANTVTSEKKIIGVTLGAFLSFHVVSVHGVSPSQSNDMQIRHADWKL